MPRRSWALSLLAVQPHPLRFPLPLGVTDIHLLFTIAALMASCMLFGWQMEVRGGALWSWSARCARHGECQ